MCAMLVAIAAAGDVAAQDCVPRLGIDRADEDGLRASYVSPCAPYTAVTVTLGPLVFGEETGRDGDLRLDLPALPGGGVLIVTQGGAETRAPVPPPAGPVPAIAAVIWPDAPAPDLPGAWAAESGHGAPRRLGFPGETPQADLLPPGSTHLDLPVTPATCGRDIAGRIVTGDLTRDLRLTFPACDGPRGTLRIPLVP
jgi:hypothetical protein